MKRVVALIISIAMVASLATGLAVTGFAEDTIKINGVAINNCYTSYGASTLTDSGDTVTIDKINTNTDIIIDIPQGKTLIVYNKSSNANILIDSAIYVDGKKITIQGSGTLSATSQHASAIFVSASDVIITGGTVIATGNVGVGISADGNVEIKGGTVTANGPENGIYAGTDVKISSGIVNANSKFGIYAGTGDVTISGGKVTATSSLYGIYTNKGNVEISGGTVTAIASGYGAYCIYASNNVEISGTGTVVATGSGTNVEGIFSYQNINISSGTITANVTGLGSEGFGTQNGNVEISGGTVTANGESKGIYAGGGVTISGGTVSANGTENDSKGINANNDITISGGKVIATASGTNASGIHAYQNIKISGGTVSAKGSAAAYKISNSKNIIIDGVIISSSNYATFFDGAAGFDGTSITGTDFVTVNIPSDPEDLDDEIEESADDPDVEIDFGYGPVTLKTSNNSVVFNDTKVFEASIGDGDVFIPIDLSSAPKKIDGLFFNNDVYRFVDDSGKDIELINRFAYAEVYTNKEIGNNPLSLHLSDVSEIAGTCATYLQKKAMNTSKVYAQVNYSFVSNGKPVENDAKIYVPVDGPAKVFYLFNENKIGIVPCEVKDGYCIFDRYFDGTYVICAE